MPRHPIEELENLQVFNPPGSDLLDEATPIAGEPVVVYRASCHPRISSIVV